MFGALLISKFFYGFVSSPGKIKSSDLFSGGIGLGLLFLSLAFSLIRFLWSQDNYGNETISFKKTYGVIFLWIGIMTIGVTCILKFS